MMNKYSLERVNLSFNDSICSDYMHVIIRPPTINNKSIF